MKKLILAGLLAISAAQAGTISLNPVEMVKAFHRNTPRSRRLRLLTGAIGFDFNAYDYATTMKYTTPGGGLCETNPNLLLAPCVLNVPKFQKLKALTAAGFILQELPHWRHSPREGAWDQVFIIMNIPADILLVKVGINNFRAIRRFNAK
jgi:hypothetical protein